MPDLRKAGPGGLALLSAADARAQLDAGDITSEQLVRDCLDRIEARNADVDAWAFIDPDLALAQARERDGETSRGLLHGIPVAIKDIYDTADMPTAYGAIFYEGHQPDADSEWVSVLRAAGAVILGKARTTQFANPYLTTTRNPHDLTRAPGASSSGSAAAVADFMAPLATGSQTGGSVILPAAHCGVYGYKPTFGAFPSGNVRHSKPSIDTPGLFARTLEDVALMRATSLGEQPVSLDAAGDGPLRVGVCRTQYWPDALPETISTLAESAGILADAGAEVSERELPAEVDEAVAHFTTIVSTEDARALPTEARDHFDELNPWAQNSTCEGAAFSEEEYENAKQLAEAARAATDALFNDYNVLITPATAGEAPADLVSMEPSLFNRIWTQMYVPCLSLPLFTGPNGMPVGLQIVARRGDDARLLAIGRWVETAVHAAQG